MHIEKNFFDNIMNTVFNVKGKTKDNLKSRLDLPTLCARSELHVRPDGKGPIPIFRLNEASKHEFLQWIIEYVRFPDGYASNLRHCVDKRDGKLSGMKSHDCHVFMQRLLPFAFAGLLPKKVHEAIAGISSFFRDLCSRSFTYDGIRQLEQNIPVILCNLEKIFPPSFFDVMEHLPVHLPHEALLAGPVQYRWMYPFERFMFHLKKKVKNLSRVEGSIVAQSINEETSYFSSYYFGPEVQTKGRKPGRNDDGGEKPNYPSYVPSLFAQVGRLSYKPKKRWLTDLERGHLHTYILLNCEDVFPYERLFVAQLQTSIPSITDEEVERKKLTDFSNWLQFYVYTMKQRGAVFPEWLQDLVNGPVKLAMTSRIYSTRGYSYKIYRESDNQKTTINSGICSQSGDITYYGRLQEILEIQYPGSIKMKCIVFLCEWFDPQDGRGVRHTKFGVTEVNFSKRLNKYDPFILAAQADQVTYIPYPRLTQRNDPWVTVTKVYPRGRVLGSSSNETALQEAFISSTVGYVEQSVENTPLVDMRVEDVEDLQDVNEDEGGEFEDSSSSSLDMSDSEPED